MSEPQSKTRRWIGLSIIGISIIHTLFAVAVFGPVLGEILAEGLVNSVGEDAMRGAVSWFVFAGFFMFTTGLFVDHLERNNLGLTLTRPGWVLLAITILGIVMMPVSGFWLMLVPAIAMIVAGSRQPLAR